MVIGNMRERVVSWFEERYDFSPVYDLMSEKEVPVHKHSYCYYLGGLTLFFFLVEVVTGILLLLYYRPSPDNAHESIKFIMSEVHFGWLIRSMHGWAGNIFIAMLLVHMVSTYFLKAYRKPRELTWLTGIFLFFLALGFAFSGYLLPWDTLSYFATRVGTDMATAVPLIGNFLGRFLRGGEEVSGATLTRFFGFHVAVLPMITTFMLALHIYFIQKQGMSIPIDYENRIKKMKKFFPDVFLHDIILWLVALGFLLLLVTVFPWGLGEKANPFAPAPAGIKPEWYFLYIYETLKFIPSKVLFIEGEILGVSCALVFFTLLVFVPFLDRKAARNEKGWIFTGIGIVVLLYAITMSILSHIL